MVTNSIKYFRHGSEDSLDADVFFIVERLSDVKHDNKILCDALSKDMGVNGNIITIGGEPRSRVVTGVFKGTIDEVNNGLLSTYDLHPQLFPCPVDVPMQRDIHMKYIRVLRGLLSQCSRTEHRLIVKKALRSPNIFDKIDVLDAIKLSHITDFGGKKAAKIEVHKFIAFQIIQMLGLMRYPCREVYTKNAAASLFPSATPLLYRWSDVVDNDVIDDLQDKFIQAWYTLLDSKKTDILQNGKFLRTPFGRLNVSKERYEEAT